MTLPVNKIVVGNVLDVLKTFPDESVHTVITSPPYWGLRKYPCDPVIWDGDDKCAHLWGEEDISKKGHAGTKTTLQGTQTAEISKEAVSHGKFCQICGAWEGHLGLEPTPQLFVLHIVQIFREIRRVLRSDGTCWMNFGDSYCSQGGQRKYGSSDGGVRRADAPGPRIKTADLKPKNLLGIPWRVAFALQDDGWYLRSDIIWSKPNPMPESVTDRPYKSHEYIFLLTKSSKYFYDAEAVREKGSPKTQTVSTTPIKGDGTQSRGEKVNKWMADNGGRYNPPDRNLRTVWEIATQAYPEAHFATFPEKLVQPCVLAGTSESGCCAKCGGPQIREIERVDTGKFQKMSDGWDTGSGGHGTVHREGRQKGESGKPVMESVTTGWASSCECDAAVVPAVVLDPFIGSGTVALVALKAGRKFIGIDITESYAQLARKRIELEITQRRLF